MLNLHEKFIVDEKGKKTATVLPYAEWRKIAAILDEYEDIIAYDKAKARPSHPISFKKAIKKLRS
ncbi:hypothetical protein AYO45_06735 [Gammaproteobacteria bacterium SCGC AG-212-F23]|nr:hypothetical protein AYO45_06735 [Gammaproteobacteria bacterium SCGC AG-212-F23]